MAIIYSNVSNENYTVCCMGQTVYVYKKSGSELARFTLAMADFPVISPNGNVFAVKSKDGCVAVYSFEKLSRVATLKFSDKETSYEKGMCFSADGSILYNVEYSSDGTCICAYSMESNSIVEKNNFAGVSISHIEYDNGLWAIGTDSDKSFVAKIVDGKLSDVKAVTEEDYNYYYNYICASLRGFSSAAMDLYMPKIDDVDAIKTSLSDLWSKTVDANE